MTHLIRRFSKELKRLFLIGLFALALVTTLFASPQPTAVHAADPTPIPVDAPEGWTDPIGG